jgi:hypothetical protein
VGLLALKRYLASLRLRDSYVQALLLGGGMLVLEFESSHEAIMADSHLRSVYKELRSEVRKKKLLVYDWEELRKRLTS